MILRAARQTTLHRPNLRGLLPLLLLPQRPPDIVIDGSQGVDNVEGFKELGKDGTSITAEMPEGFVDFSSEAVLSITSGMTNPDLTLVLQKVESSVLTSEQIEAAGGSALYELALYDGMRPVTGFNGAVKVGLAYQTAEGESLDTLVAYSLSEDGELEVIPTSLYDTAKGALTFSADTFGMYVIGHGKVGLSDIAGHWAAADVTRSAARGLASGYTDGTFKPDAPTTRAEFVQFVYNVAGINMTTGSAFGDVTEDKWYYAAVSALESANVLQGLERADGSFAPNEAITRAEMAVILSNLVQAKGASATGAFSANSFADFADIGAYAASVENAVNAGLLNAKGMGDGTFAPNGSVTRAQAAVIQMTVLKVLNGM